MRGCDKSGKLGLKGCGVWYIASFMKKGLEKAPHQCLFRGLSRVARSYLLRVLSDSVGEHWNF